MTEHPTTAQDTEPAPTAADNDADASTAAIPAGPDRPATTALQVANHIIARAAQNGETIEPSKLQALLYFSQACHLAITGLPLFADPILAGAEGPYVESVAARNGR